MTQQPPPPDQPTQPGPPPGWGPPPTPPRPPKAGRTFSGRAVAGLVAGAFVVGLLLRVAAGGGSGGTSSGGRPNAAATTTTAAEEQVTTSPGPSYDEPQPSDFELNVKVLQKENFGEAGSNVTFRIEAAWDKTYHPSKTYEVTYEVRGTEGGPMINTFTVTGDRYETTKEELAQTPSTSTKLTARVTDVEEA
jgi:hypothetical protein